MGPAFWIFTDLTIERFCMTGGKSPIGYLKAYMTNLYLSKDAAKVTEAIEEGELYAGTDHHILIAMTQICLG